tara:strand:- start:732 stop:1493 length:762 start_codon:yes stop_codon:yes gene_type:complete
MDQLKKNINLKNYNNEFSKALLDMENIFFDIYQHCNFEFDLNCGSYLFDGKKYEYSLEMYDKQKLLFESSKQINSVLEIGVYMGHSLLIILMANPHVTFTGIDIDEKYSAKAINLLSRYFPNSKLEFIHSDSLKVLKKLNKKYDLFHIDGSHSSLIIFKELRKIFKLVNNQKLKVVFDDVDTCQNVIDALDKSFKIKKIVYAESKWRNCYLEIDLNKIIIKNLLLFHFFFYTSNYSIFYTHFKYKIKKLIKKS